jgi:hypothetical protein
VFSDFLSFGRGDIFCPGHFSKNYFSGIVPKTLLELAAKKITEELNLFTVKIKKKNQMTKFRSYLKKIQNCMTNTVISVKLSYDIG